MLIKKIFLKNFRGYQKEIIIPFNKLTVLIGRNDIGKSTIMEALDIFFNDGKGVVAMDKSDVNVFARNEGDTDVVIAVKFNNLPDKIIIDSTNETTLSDEYLLDKDGDFTLVKHYPNGSSKSKVYVRANHPSNPKCQDLLSLKQNKLKEKVDELGLDCDKTRNAEMRKAIWTYYSEALDLQEQEIETTKDGMKDIYEQIRRFLPQYSLFQADRNNSDKDKEAQDPLKEAVKIIMSNSIIEQKCNEIALAVSEELQNVANATLTKLREMNPELADSLHARIPTSAELKWSDVFKSVSIDSENGIPLNKRGSGVKRLVLLNFFRAEADKHFREEGNTSIIYAIEEPETSQHIHHQKILIDSLKKLSEKENVQILLTTHSSFIVKQLDFSVLRLIKEDRNVSTVEKSLFPYPSLNEINCKMFGDYSVEFHNELYGFLQSIAIDENPVNGRENKFEQWLVSKGIHQTKQWTRRQNGEVKPAVPSTLETYVRNFIHHPENKFNTVFTIDELKQSITEMIALVKNLQN